MLLLVTKKGYVKLEEQSPGSSPTVGLDREVQLATGSNAIRRRGGLTPCWINREVPISE